MADGPAEPIQSPHQKHVALAKLSEARFQSTAIFLCSRGLVSEEQRRRNAMLAKCVNLKLQVLL